MHKRRHRILKLAMTIGAAIAPMTPAAAQAPAAASEAKKTVARISMISANPQALKRFYTEVFGFVPVWQGVIGEGANAQMIARAWRLQPDARLNGALLRAPRGDMELQITYVTGQTIKPMPRVRSEAPMSGDHYFVIHVPNLAATVERMKPFGTEFNRPPMEMTAIDKKGRSYPVHEAVIYDPEGTMLIIVQDVELPA